MSNVRCSGRSVRGGLATAALALFAGATAIAGTVAGLGVPAAASSAAEPATGEIGTAVSRGQIGTAASRGQIGTAVSRGQIGTAVAVNPTFLTSSQLPQGKRYGSWSASRVYSGTPKSPVFCLDDALPAADTRYVSYKGKKNVAAQEFVTETESEAAAVALVSSLRTQIQDCYTEWLDLKIPAYSSGKRKASWKRYGTEKIEDGMTVFGVFTVPPKGFAKTTHLYAVGRDGNAVMVLHLGVLGSRGDAPVKSFTKSGKRALRQVS